MSRRMILMLVFAVSLLGLTLAACGHEYGYRHYPYGRYGNGYYNNSYQSPQRAYDMGYRQGFDRGSDDQRSGYRFDYDDYREYKSGISPDSRINDAFRDGFSRGYRDGYYGRGGRDDYGYGQ